MLLVPARGRAGHLARFRRLLIAAITSTFLLTVIGGVVRVSESGLGCGAAGSGTEGWPLCGGQVLPGLEAHAVVEFSHRVAATVVVVLIGAMTFLALRRLRDRRWLVRGSIAAAVLVLAQAALGGLTVEHGLAEALVAAHLGVAMLLLALLLTMHRLTAEEHSAPVSASFALKAASAAAVVLLLTTIVAGGLVAGTEREGTGAVGHEGAHLACGREFPTCLDGFMPFGTNRLVDIQLTHRLAMFLAAAAVATMAALAIRRRVPGRAFRLAPILLAGQILLGAMNVWLGEHPELVVAHLTLATLLWLTVVRAASTLLTVPQASQEPAGTPETDSRAVAA